MVKSIFALISMIFLCERFADGAWIPDWKNSFRGSAARDSDLTFRLYRRNSYENGVQLFTDDRVTLLTSGFNSSLPTKICTHGYLDSVKTWIVPTRKEILKLEDVNFIAVDWSPCANNLLYDRVVVCMKELSSHLGNFLKFLRREGNLDFRKTHMIGHSLGAHMMALAANTLSRTAVIGRITGLDPAAPLFEHVPAMERLNPKSAKFVDVIHTSSFFVGVTKPVGTVDFYPNGGYFQPGCQYFDLSCNHNASQWYLINTIRNRNKYPAKRCKTVLNAFKGTCYGETGLMGYFSQKSSPGIYYIKVTSVS